MSPAPSGRSASSAAAPASAPSRPFDFRLALGLPLALMATLLIVEPTVVDFALERLFYSPGAGFVGRHAWLLENVLHDGVKQLVIAVGVAAIAGFVLSLWTARFRPWRRELGYVVVAIALSTGIVTPLKKLTGVHCPWSLAEFGGTETYTPLLAPRAPTLDPGRCWPGGHASAGFSLLALYFARRDRRPRQARAALAVALGLGAVFSVGRMMQGAHFLSHNVWTLLFDWVICVVAYRMILYRPRRAAASAPTPVGAEARASS